MALVPTPQKSQTALWLPSGASAVETDTLRLAPTWDCMCGVCVCVCVCVR